MDDQLLDVTIIVASVNTTTPLLPYAQTKIWRVDLEKAHLETFLKAIESTKGVARLDQLAI